jgi:hypothetical protein
MKGFVIDKKTKLLFDYIKDSFIHSCILLPSGRIVQKHTGIPSGSGLTSLIGSIANMLIIEYAMGKIKKE